MLSRILEEKIGPVRIRALGLIVNFGANLVALYGLSLFMREQGGLVYLIAGGLGTLAMITILATPAKD